MAKDKPAPKILKKTPRHLIDWEAIRREFRAGILSVREIATKQGVSHTAVNKQAKKHKWKRNLTKRVHEAIAQKLVSEKVAEKVSIAEEDGIVEEAAARALAVIKRHRQSIAKLDEVKIKILQELHDNPKKLWVGQFQGKIITKEVSITATEKSSALLALAGVEERRIKLERQAFGISDGPSGDDDIKEIPIVFDSAGERQ